MSIQIHILDAAGNLRSQRDSLRKHAKLTVIKVQAKIALDNVDIVIKESETPEIFKDMDGIGGYCPSGFFVQLSIDKNHPSFLKSSGKVIEKTLIHELHHAARMQAGVLMNRSTFLEYLFSEGLADNFVHELTGDMPIWIPQLDKDDKRKLLRRAKRRFSNNFTPKDHRLWFIEGSKSQHIPRFAGYAIGYDIVSNYLKRNPDKSAASLVNTPVEKVLGFL
jgi:hypothetical protein